MLFRQALEQVWLGETVVCIASGPSLTQADCDLVGASGLTTVVVNSSWKRARFASVIYGADFYWWDKYGREIDIDAERWTWSRRAADTFGLNHDALPLVVENSGLRAIDFAIRRGAKKVILLGYDCSVNNGVHWHSDYPDHRNPDAVKCKTWQRQFAQLNRRGCIVVNCSRYTALSCFPKNTLEGELC